jgi:hypothetical protein
MTEIVGKDKVLDKVLYVFVGFYGSTVLDLKGPPAR